MFQLDSGPVHYGPAEICRTRSDLQDPRYKSKNTGLVRVLLLYALRNYVYPQKCY
jgi:hypothetical protein